MPGQPRRDPDAPPDIAPHGPAGDRAVSGVRRAILPWYRKTPAYGRFLYVPRWARRVLVIPVLNLLFLVVTFPVWAWLLIPPIVALAAVVVEGLLAVLLCPVALAYRRMRDAWPVETLGWRGEVLSRAYHPTWAEAGASARELREQHRATVYGNGVGTFLQRDDLRGNSGDSGPGTVGDAVDLGMDIF